MGNFHHVKNTSVCVFFLVFLILSVLSKVGVFLFVFWFVFVCFFLLSFPLPVSIRLFKELETHVRVSFTTEATADTVTSNHSSDLEWNTDFLSPA